MESISLSDVTKTLEVNGHHVLITYQSMSNCLFTSAEFVAYQEKVQHKKNIIFTLLTLDNNVPQLQLDFNSVVGDNQGLFYSPITGAFSDVSFLQKRVKPSILSLFLSYIEIYLFENFGAKHLTIKLPPEIYGSENTNLVINSLFNLDWKIKDLDLNYHFDLFSEDDFKSNLSSSKRRELNRLNRADTIFSKAENESEIISSYEIIKSNRTSQGYPMTMSQDSLLDLYKKFPNKVHFFNLKKAEEILASAVCLSISSDYLYIFYWGENPQYRNLSPVIKLAQQLYSFAMSAGFKKMDIGISTENSIPNQGLMDFKTNLGCRLTKKITLNKKLG